MNDFEKTYTRYAREVYRLCLRAVSRPEVAEDLTSEVFLLYHKQRATINPEMLPGWLFTVAKRRAADYWRHRYVEQRWAAVQPEAEPATPHPELSLEALLAGCAALKPVHRVCLILRFRHGLTRAEIATRTGLTELQVKSALQYGLRLLRDSAQGGNDQGATSAAAGGRDQDG